MPISNKEVNKMSKKEKEVIKTIAKALPKMTDFDKGYFLGVAENSIAQKASAEKSDCEEETKSKT